MARGWESKNIEEQQAARERDRQSTDAPDARDPARLTRRRTLELARARAVADLSAARTDAHRRMLEATIAALDEQLRNV